MVGEVGEGAKDTDGRLPGDAILLIPEGDEEVPTLPTPPVVIINLPEGLLVPFRKMGLEDIDPIIPGDSEPAERKAPPPAPAPATPSRGVLAVRVG